MEAAARTNLRRRISRRSRYQRDDLRIEIRDDDSDGEDSPSPYESTFSPSVTKTHSPKTTQLPPPPPPVLNPANPSESESPTTSSPTISARPTQPPPPPQPQPTSFSSVIRTGAEPSGTPSSLPTAVPNGRATSTDLARTTSGPRRGGSDNGLGDDRSAGPGWTPTAIAFGTIAIAALFLCIGVGIWWCLKYRKRHKARQYERSITPDGNYWNPESSFSPPTAPPPKKRTASSLMAEIMGHVYGAENGSRRGSYNTNRNSLTPQGYLDEKTYDPSRQLPILEPAPVAQPNVRNSIASWIRRHHPLKLNPLSGRSSVYSTRTVDTSTTDVNTPPVPAVPDAYRPPSQQSNLTVPQANGNGNNPRYTASSRYGNDSILSFYESAEPQPQRPGQPAEAPWLQDPPPVAYGERGVSMAPTEATARTESTWRSWGGGVTQPRDHSEQQEPPMPPTPRRGWIERCIKFGGLK